MNKQRSFWPHLLVVLALVALAGLLRFWLAPMLTRLPAAYSNETRYAADTRFRESPTAEWTATSLIARRVDQTLTASEDTSIIQGDVHWTTEDGTPTYETTTLYGVDRRTRMNRPGYGDRNRTGQFLFPQHVQQTTYELWDPYYFGPQMATFRGAEAVDGLSVYVFDYVVAEVDDTAGYTFLPDVPARYYVHSGGQGMLWIEPTSGVVVDFKDEGVSYFVDVKTSQRVADLYHWSARYTPETRAAQLARARADRTWILALALWAPGGLLIASLLWLGTSLWRRRK